MKNLKDIDEFYKARLQEASSDYEILWGEQVAKKSIERFSIFEKISPKMEDKILDLGCGLCDLYKYLNIKFGTQNYIGVDAFQEFLTQSSRKFPNIQTLNYDFTNIENVSQDADYISIFGSLNKWWTLGDSLTCEEDIENFIVKLYLKSNKGVIFNGFSEFGDYRKDENIYLNVSRILDKLMRAGSQEIFVRRDKPIYEISIMARK